MRYNDIIASEHIDERDISITNNGEIIYSNDVNGIFNLALNDSSFTKYITNVPGGAFHAGC